MVEKGIVLDIGQRELSEKCECGHDFVYVLTLTRVCKGYENYFEKAFSVPVDKIKEKSAELLKASGCKFETCVGEEILQIIELEPGKRYLSNIGIKVL